MRLVLIETLGNQAYVFSSNRLREMMGASEQIRRLGAVWASEACADLGGLLVLATSGKAMMRVGDKQQADRLVARVVQRALEEAPGLSVMGAHVELDEAADAAGFHRAVTAVHRELSRLRGMFPPAQAHLARIPFAEDCHSTGQGAAGYDLYDPYDPASGEATAPLPYSQATLAKRAARNRAKGNLLQVLNIPPEKLHEYDRKAAKDRVKHQDFDDFNSTWRAVVHADGNGMGEVFLRFGECVTRTRGTTASDYISAFQDFSQALDEANSRAVKAATETTWQEFFKSDVIDPRGVPMKPVVLAGDDLTVICDGARAVQFAAAFVENFRRETAASPAIRRIMEAAETLFAEEGRRERRAFEGITSGAGVAIVKPHHPFHRAYELSEALAKSAKGLPKRLGLSALDVHVSYDGASDLDEIRQPKGNPEHLFAGPYLTGTAGHERHFFFTTTQLITLVEGFGAPEPAADVSQPKSVDEVPRIPASQLHALRDSVTFGEAVAKAAVARIEERYRPAFERLKGTINPLFVAGLEGGPRRTILLDAMVLADVRASDQVKKDMTDGEAA